MIVRVVTCLLVLVVGAVVGTIGTIAHQAVLAAFGARLPAGIVLAALAVGLLLAGLRLVEETRLLAACGVVGVVAAVGLFTLQGPGGSVLVPANPVAVAWLVSVGVLSALALAWPRSLRRRREDGPGR